MTEQPLLPDPLVEPDLPVAAGLGARVRERIARRRRRRTAGATVVLIALGAASFGLWPRDGDRPQTLIQGPGSEYVTGSWKVLPAGPLSPRRPYGVVAVGDEALVLGGSGPCADGTVCPELGAAVQLLDAAAYDVKKRTWRTIADLPELLSPEAVLDDLVVARHDEPYDGDSMAYFQQTPRRWLYSISADTWTRMPDPPRGELRVTAAGGQLIAVPQDHGFPPSKQPFDVFDPSSMSWQELPASPLTEQLEDSPLEGATQLEVLHSRSGLITVVGQDAILDGGASTADVPGRMATPVLRYAQLDLATRSWGKSGVIAPCTETGPEGRALSDDEVVIQSLAALNARRDRSASIGQAPVLVDLRSGTCSVFGAEPPYGAARGRDGLTVGSGGDYVSVGGAGPVFDTRTGRYLIYPPDIPRDVPSYAATTWVAGRFFAWGGGRDEQYGFGYGQEDYLMSTGAVWTP